MAQIFPVFLRVFLAAFFLLHAAALHASASTSTNPIAYISSEGDLYLIEPDGEGKRRLASGEMLERITFSPQWTKQGRDFYSWPVWSPEGKRVACFRFAIEEDGPTEGLYIFDARSSQVLDAYQEQGLHPIYAYWSPNGQNLGVLLGGQGELSLGLWPVAGQKRPQTIAQGAPFYFHWRTDAQAVVAHVGGDAKAKEGHSVSVINIKDGVRQLVSLDPASFGPPSWSSDNRWLAYGDRAKDRKKTKLLVARPDGSAPKLMGLLPTKIAMEWSPTQSRLAVATSSREGDPLLEELQIIDVPSGKTHILIKDSFAAYFWSPDGERILYARRKLGTDLWTWAVAHVQDETTYDVIDFVPSRQMLMVFQYFDQYALSHRVWSPDSKQFVFAGAAGSDAQPEDGIQNPSIYTVEAKKDATPHMLADGHIAFWSPQ